MTNRCAVILNNIVTNIIVADPNTFELNDGSFIVQSDIAQTGDEYNNGIFTPVIAVVSNQIADLTFLQFMNLFTPTEQAAIINSTDVQVKLFCLQAAASDDITLTDLRVIQGVGYLSTLNLITAARVPVILSGAAHS